MPTKIEWTDETWNPTTGCSKVSQGCKNCYALREWSRLAANPKATAYFGREFTDVACHPDRLDAPLRWTKPRKVFVNSMSDLFHESVPDDFIDRVFAVMALSPQHTFQVLTKRPKRMLAYMTQDGHGRWGFIDGRARQIYAAQRGRRFPAGKILLGPLPNVWLGVSVEDQPAADERIPLLLQTPAAVRWISAEPLLGEVDLRRVVMADGDALGAALYNDGEAAGLDWVVVGGESGPKARPMHPHWAFSLRDQCDKAGVPFMFKQWGEWVPRSACYHTFAEGIDCASLDMGATKWTCIRLTERGHNGRDLAHAGEGDHAYMQRVGKKMAGRLLQGALHDGYPAENA
ncbi:MAG: phage Gp37/Gp68 family protein [Acidobacteriaceae bacterium]